uniref:Uncharacterized protein n=1 Tax=Globisporangium ultimum (strain ATCC 200006 / CBS 805.95 / DAOM BR144) TaxID=431595 RepID=K3X929_GLOUD
HCAIFTASAPVRRVSNDCEAHEGIRRVCGIFRILAGSMCMKYHRCCERNNMQSS